MLIPSIDLMNKKVVQLRQGKEKILELDDWQELVRNWALFSEIAVIDIDQATGAGSNQEIVQQIIEKCRARVGGGIRTVKQAEELFRAGASKIIVSSALFQNGKIDFIFIDRLLQAVPSDTIIFALDSFQEDIVINGWKKSSGVRLAEALQQLKHYQTGFLITFVEQEGTESGLPIEKIRDLRSKISNYLVVAGGARNVEEIVECDRLGVDVQAGMALYRQKIDPFAVLTQLIRWQEGLVPVVIQDYAGQVLTLAYSNADSLKMSLQTGQVWLYSRSRRRLWQKGEESGNFQRLLKLELDCDRDALLFTVEPFGPACHRLSYSCFGDGREEFKLEKLLTILQQRLQERPENSYSASLSPEKRFKKLLEECLEVILAKNQDQLVWEVADLLYFLTLIMADSRISYEMVLSELKRRKK